MIFARAGLRPPELQVNSSLIAHDLHYFLIAYTLALMGTFLSPFPVARGFLACFIFAIYPYYVYQTVKREQEMGSKPENLHFARILRLGKPDRLSLIIPQVVAGVGGIFGGRLDFCRSC